MVTENQVRNVAVGLLTEQAEPLQPKSFGSRLSSALPQPFLKRNS